MSRAVPSHPQRRHHWSGSNTAGQDRTIRLEALPDDVETVLVQTDERGYVGDGEGSVRHIEETGIAVAWR